MTRTNDNGIERDMTADEETAHAIIIADNTARQAADDKAATAQAAAKKSAEAKLAALGLTADEISAL
jgi:hypothetical protein